MKYYLRPLYAYGGFIRVFATNYTSCDGHFWGDVLTSGFALNTGTQEGMGVVCQRSPLHWTLVRL